MMSSGWAPACRAAASTNSLMLEPVWRGASAMLTSRSLGTNPCPPTIARIAPVLVSSETIEASKPLRRVGQDVAGLPRPAPGGTG